MREVLAAKSWAAFSAVQRFNVLLQLIIVAILLLFFHDPSGASCFFGFGDKIKHSDLYEM